MPHATQSYERDKAAAVRPRIGKPEMSSATGDASQQYTPPRVGGRGSEEYTR